jgi:hypothetical protein
LPGPGEYRHTNSEGDDDGQHGVASPTHGDHEQRADGDRGDDVGGVTVQRLAATVIAHRRPRVGVTGGFLHVAQRDTGVQSGGDEGVTQRVRSDPLADPSTASDTAHDPPGSVPIEPVASGSEEDRTFHPFPDRQVDSPGNAWSERHRHQLAALAQHGQRAMSTLQPEGLDVGTDRLRHAQPAQPTATPTHHPAAMTGRR